MPPEDVTTELNTDDLSNQEIARLIQERYNSTHNDQPAAETGEEPQLSATEAPTSPPPEPEPPAPPELPSEYDFGDGLVLNRDQAHFYAEFHQFLQDNPEFARATQTAWESVEHPPPPAEQQVVIPEDLDLADPNINFLWEQLQSTRGDLTKALERIQASETAINTQTSATTESLVNRAVASFKQQKNLTEDETRSVREVAARLEVLPSLMAPVDPVTNLPRKVDPLAAIESALDTAYWTIPKMRDRELQLLVDQRATDDKRKQQLSSLGGSSGSVPRTPPKPQTKEELHQAMVADITEAMFGPSQSNEE